jgi:Ca2+-binding RTX toxin-like protein
VQYEASVGTDVEGLEGGFASDILTGSNGDNEIFGGASNDIIMGLGGDDTLLGGAGYVTNCER